jgi:hypothetical protein
MMMGYFWPLTEMIDQFKQYAAIVGSQNLLFGVGGDPFQTPLSESEALAAWEPATGNKGGMMEFNINDDPNYQTANAIIKALSSEAAATAG